ncbi:hypothetical protein NKT34_30190 [Paenibacillus polysaccharolyticus]|uniref:hypothetical protein n=1 Tax=Paenibacillus TaxID=44249 RepID=UPI0008CFA582|nr:MULTISPECIES: hypothetical protein [Paenibacillus]MCP1137533.1 hypothetical protein [Paenibacillus polysaccharolyticus]SEP33645.1 hypothetical protein SAMN05518670_6612 [Paenibacillus sp. OK076]
MSEEEHWTLLEKLVTERIRFLESRITNLTNWGNAPERLEELKQELGCYRDLKAFVDEKRAQ